MSKKPKFEALSPATHSAQKSPSKLIDAKIKSLTDWRGATLAHVRKIMQTAVPDVIEEWKWRDVPVWSHNGIICTGETYKAAVKLTFARGAALADPSRLFNASLDGTTRRAIDIHDGDTIDKSALGTLFRAAMALNAATLAARSAKSRSEKKPARKSKTAAPAARRNKASS